MYPPPRLHQQAGVGDTEAHVSGPLGQNTQARCQGRIDHNHLAVKRTTILICGWKLRMPTTCTSHSSQLEWDRERWDWRTWTPLAFCSGWQGGWWQGWRLHRTGTHQVTQVWILKNVFNIDAFKMLPKCKVVFCKTRSVVCTCITARGAGQADVQSGVGRGPSLQRVRVCDLRQDKVNNVLYN